MNITVDRHNKDDQLVFTITVKDPHKVPFTEIDAETILYLNSCKEAVEGLGKAADHPLVGQAVNALHEIQSRTFNRVKDSLMFALRHQLQAKYEPIIQEIYNWLYDKQEGYVKEWMQSFDPQRTTYYFDNDRTIESDYGYEND
jgi:hypothetical protein